MCLNNRVGFYSEINKNREILLSSLNLVIDSAAYCRIVRDMSIRPLLCVSLMAVASCVSAVYATVSVIPRPVEVKEASNAKSFNLMDFAVSIDAGKDVANEKDVLKTALENVGVIMSKEGKSLPITLKIDSTLPKEGYALNISEKGIRIAGGSPSGVFYGVQTFKQMLPPQAFSLEKTSTKPNAVPLTTVEIKDQPTCLWRGTHIDSARHFMPKEFIFKFLDAMAAHKLNRLHWHIVDSEGWRMEVKKYPKLVEVTKDFPAEYPSEDPTDKSRPAVYQYGKFHGGGYYTQEEIKEIVAYAKKRHIEIMPELGFPAHAMVALTAYPEFSTTRKAPVIQSNISPDLYGVHPEAIEFLTDVLDEAMALFPFEVIHFGGDEAPKGQWKDSAEVQALMKKEGLKDENEVQAWVFNILAKHIEKQGRRPAGWEEIMHGSNMDTLTKTAMIYPWLSRANGVKSANEGYPIIHCSVGPFYLDSWQTNSPADNWTLYRGPMTLESIYTYNLYPDELTEKGKNNVAGAQCMLWSELMTKPEHVEYQAFPRLAALAELTWTPKERKDYQNFYKRLLDHTKRMDVMKLNYRYVNPLPVVSWSPELLNSSSFTVDVTDQPLTLGENQKAVVEFNYKNGASGLETTKVELLANGKVIAVDEHEGNAGNNHTDNTYKLTYSLPKSYKGKVALRISHANSSKNNSHGDALLYTDKGVELFNPANFAGGDYPSASWTTGDTKKAKASFRVPMDGIVRSAGNYEMIIDTKVMTSPIKISNIVYQGTKGVTGKSTETAVLSKDQKRAFLPMTINPKDMEHGSSVVFTIESATPSSADVRLRQTKSLNVVNPQTFSWSPETLTSGAIIAYAPTVTPKKGGVLKVKFNFKGGSNGLDITAVQLLEKGKIIAQSTQKGFAGGNSRDNEYTLSSPLIKAGAIYSLRMNIAGAGGNNSNGELVIVE